MSILQKICLGACMLLFLPSLAAAVQQPSANVYAGMQWRLIGPYRSGNVYAVAGVSNDPNVYYLGMPEGGVWKTTNGGTVWKPIFDQKAVPSIGAVAVAPSSPDTVYVGTGNPTNWSFTAGNGVFKSTDAGKHWTRLSLTGTAYIPALLVDPHDANLVLVAAQGKREGTGAATTATAMGGVFRTTDGGLSWQRTLALGTGVVDMAWDYQDPKLAYAVVRQDTREALYKSIDEGASWQRLAVTGLPDHLQGMTVAVAAGTHGRRVYLLASRTADRGVYRSDDGGATWQLATTKLRSADGRIYVAPSNPDEVYLMGTSLYRSVDGAHNFLPIAGAPGGNDYRALWIDPANPRRLLAGVDQGPAISVDGGETWTPWYNLPNGQFYTVVTDNQFPYMVYGPMQDIGSEAVRSRSDYGSIGQRDWYGVADFEYNSMAVDPLNPRWVYSQGGNQSLRRFDRKTGQVAEVYTPTPKERFAHHLQPLVFSPTDPHRLYQAFQHVLATDDGGLHWSKLGGDLTRRPTPAGAPASAACTGWSIGRVFPCAIRALAPSPMDGQVLWAGTNNGLVQLSRDGGKTWSDVTPSQLSARTSVFNIDASHHDPAIAYVAAQGIGDNTRPYLLRTTDYGKTWRPIITGLPDNVRTRVVREDPEDGNLLYAGTETGAWVSFDRGNRWRPLQLNLPHTVVSGMQVHGNDLVISTYGRAFWILDDVTPLRQMHEAMTASAVYFFKPEIAMRVRWSNNQNTPEPKEMPVGQNPPEGAILDYYLAAQAKSPMELSIYDSAGHLVRKYSSQASPRHVLPANVPAYWFPPPARLGTSAGMHRFVWDLRFPDPKTLSYGHDGKLLDYTRYTQTWHAVEGHTPQVQPVGPLALPGTYQVKLVVDGHTYTRELAVKNDPRSTADAADLQAQLVLQQRVMAGLQSSFEAVRKIFAQQKALAAVQTTTAADASVSAAVKALSDQIAPLSAGSGDSGFGVANRGLEGNMEDLEFGDFRPSPSMHAAVQSSCKRIAEATTTLQHSQRQELAALNRTLVAARLKPIPPISVTGSGCGP